MLSDEEIERFVDVGWLRIDGAIPPEVATRCREEARVQLSVPDGPPWPEPVIRGLLLGPGISAAASSPRLDEAVGQLLAGEGWQRRPTSGCSWCGVRASPTRRVSLATGRAGDVYLCHPFLVHAASWPHRGTAPRYLAQPPIAIDGELRTDRAFPGLSPAARAIAPPEAISG